MDSVVIVMILVAALAGGIVSLVHRGRARTWGLIAALLGFGIGVFLYNYISLFRNWKQALLITIVCIVLLDAIYLLLAISSVRRNRQKNNRPAQNADREVISTPPRTPIPISDWEASIPSKPALNKVRVKVVSRTVPEHDLSISLSETYRPAGNVGWVAAPDMEAPNEPPVKVMSAERTFASSLMENAISEADETPEQPIEEPVKEPVEEPTESGPTTLPVEEPTESGPIILPVENTVSEVYETSEHSVEEPPEPEPVILTTENTVSEADETSEQFVEEPTELEPPELEPAVLTTENTVSVADEASEQSVEEPPEPEPVILPAENTDLRTGNASEWPVEETVVSEPVTLPAEITDLKADEVLEPLVEEPAESEPVILPAEIAGIEAENIPEQPAERIESKPSRMPFEDYMNEITGLVAAKRYADAQSSIFKMLNLGYDMTADDKQRVLLIMKLLKEREKRADGATRTH